MASTCRIGLIGVGRWGRAYLRTLQAMSDVAHLSHVCTRRPPPADLIDPTVSLTNDWREVCSGDLCDAVIIATPPDTHAEIVEHCLESGQPCLVEKPLCLGVDEAERLAECASRTGTPVLVDHTFLFTREYETLKLRLRERREAIRAIVSEGYAFGPFRSHTSALWDWCPHDVAFSLDLTGRRPERVEAIGGFSDPDGEPEMIALRLSFSDGADAWIQAGRLSLQKTRRVSVLTDFWAYRFDDRSNQPLSEARVEFADRYEAAPPGAIPWSPIDIGKRELPLTSVVRYFVAGLASGPAERFGLELAIQVVRVLEQADEALANRTSRGRVQ